MVNLQLCAEALACGKDPEAQHVCVVELSGYFADQLLAHSKVNATELNALLAIAKLLLARLGHAADNLEQLLRLADSCFTCCEQLVSGTKHRNAFNVLLYSYVKKLVGLKHFQAALQHGQLLLADLQQQEVDDTDKSTQDLLLGAALNVIICTCKVDQDVLPLLHGVNTATVHLLYTLRFGEAQAAAQHAALSKYLLELVDKSSAEAAQHRNTHCSHERRTVEDITQLLALTVAAASMTNQQSMLQQVALRVAQLLPLDLKYCSIAAMLQVAGLQPLDSSSNSTTINLPSVLAGSQAANSAPTTVAGLQVLVAAVSGNLAAAAACARGLLMMSHANGLCAEGCMIMTVLASFCESQLETAELNAIAAAATAAEQQCTQCDAAEQQIDDLTGQLSSISIAELARPRHRANQIDKSNKPCRSKQSAAADEVQQRVVSDMQLEVAAWCIQWLATAKAQGPQLATASAACTVRFVSMMADQHEASSLCSIPWQLAAQAIALAGSLLAGGSTSSSGLQQQQLLQQLCKVTQDLLGMPRMCSCTLLGNIGQPDAAAAIACSSSCCPFIRSELQWLSWQLYDLAVRAGGSIKQNSSSGSSTVTSSLQQDHWAASHLLLLGWQCSCACLTQTCQQQQAEAERATAVTELLQHAQAHLSYLWCRHQEQQEGTDRLEANEQQHKDVQQVVSVSVAAALQHLQQQQEGSEHKIEHHLDKVLLLYSKLRCQHLETGSAGRSPQDDGGGSSKGASRSRPSRGRSKGTKQHRVHDQQQQLPPVVQLLAECTGSNWQPPVDIACWLECRALWKASTDPRLTLEAAATAITATMQQLSACEAPAGCDAAVFQIQKQLVVGMVQANTPSHLMEDSSSSSQQRAFDVLTTCFTQAMSLLTEQEDSNPPAAAISRAGGRRTAKQRGNKKGSQQVPQNPAAISMEVVQGLSSRLGCEAAGQVLACAAFSSCLLGLAGAAALLQHEPVDDATQAAGDDNVQPAATDLQQQREGADADISSRSGVDEAVPDSCQGWDQVCQHWHSTSQSFQLLVQLHNGSDSSSTSSMMAFVRFPLEAATAVAEAWHIAGLQGWSVSEAVFAKVLPVLVRRLPAQQRIQLQQVQDVINQLPGSGWLGVLIAPCRLYDDSSHGSSICTSSPVAPCATKAKGSRAKQTAGKVDAVQSSTSQPSACTCVLQAEQQLLMTALQQKQQLAAEETMSQQVQHGLMLLAAGQVSTALGDAKAAIVHAEASLELSKAAMLAVSSSYSNSPAGLGRVSSKRAGNSSLYWQALGWYMSGLLQLAQLLQVAGNPDDAVRVLKELSRISMSCHCSCMAALAHATTSNIYSKMGDEQKAAAAVSTAAQWLDQYQRQQQQPQQEVGIQEQLLSAVAAAAVGQAQAACYSAGCQHQEAEQQLRQQLDALEAAVQAGIYEQQQLQQAGVGQRQHLNMLLCRAIDQRARLQLQLSHVVLLTTGQAAASEQLAAAAAELHDAGGSCDRCCQTAWPAAHAALCLQQLLWSCPSSISAQPPGQQSFQLVGFSSSSSHFDLQAEFACAAANSIDMAAIDTSLDSAPAPAKGRKARSSKKQARASTSSSSSRGRDAEEGITAVDPGSWLADVLLLLPACAHDMLLLKGVCRQLSSVLQACGAVCGAAMLLHMSLGLSVAEQQQLTVASKLARAQQRSRTAELAADVTDSAAQGDQDSKCRVWEQLQQQLYLQPALNDLKDLAQQSLQQKVEPGSSSSIMMADMLPGINSIGQRWLQQQLKQLQPGTLACSITVAADQIGAGATEPRGLQPPILLPAAAQLVQPAADQGLVICRSVAAGAGSDLAQQSPLMVKLRPPNGGCIQDLLSELSSILSDSSASMQASEGLSSNTPAAAKWWKQRVALDSRLSALLKQLDQDWLGPWRCLMMQPGQQQEEQAAAQKALEFVAEHFDFVFEDVPRQLLTQLVTALLVHLNACSTAELQRAMRDLCQLTQHRVDGLHISKLVAELTELNEAVEAAGAAAAVDSSSDTNSKDKAHGGSQRRASNVGVCGDTSAASTSAYMTPAAPKARSRLGLMQASASAKKAPQSRLKAMQKATSSSNSTTSADDVSSLTSLMVKKLQLEEQEEAEASSDVAEASAAPATIVPPAPEPKRRTKAPGTAARRVRFAHNDDESDQHDAENQGLATGSHHLVPPPSLARHAVRRSRLQGLPGSSSSSGGACVDIQEENCTSSLDGLLRATATPAVSKGSRSRLSSAAVAAPATEQQHCEQWMPSVLLLLDGDVQQLPWESCPGLKQQSIYRCPGLAVAAAAAARFRLTRQVTSSSSSSSRPTMSEVAAYTPSVPRALQLSSGFFLLNPDGDLQATQNTFEDWLQQQLCLQGVSGSRPSSRELINALQQHDLFLYFGHGGGEQYVPLAALKRLDRCAGSLLMGCSSGRLRQAGVYEPSGAIWGYLMAGCPAAVANLWDVTDRDIDRFAQSVLQQWADSSKQGAKPTQNKSATPASSDSSRSDQAGGVKMCAAVAAARQACRLPHLIGAAAVCYGLPTYVGPIAGCQ